MTWSLVKVVKYAAGTVLMNPNGTIRSLNPASNTPPYGPYTWQERPANTDGAYELCAVNGTTVAYNPLGEPVVFGFQPTVPNAGGFSALSEEPVS